MAQGVRLFVTNHRLVRAKCPVRALWWRTEEFSYAQDLLQPQSESVDTISVDQLTAANAAASLAEATNLPSAGDLREATATLYIKKELSQTDTEVIAKPQIVELDSSAERGITTYTVKTGEDIDLIAANFGISKQTLRWANDLKDDNLKLGQKLVIPRTDGVVYKVKSGDTVDKIAKKYKSNADRIVLYNDLEAGKPLKAGAKLVLPEGVLPTTERPGYVAPVTRPTYNYGRNSSTTTGTRYGFGGATAGNRYAPGNCTWYAYERRAQIGRPIGGLWGNAYSWAASARAAGFPVNKTPKAGAVIQTAYGGGGYGHVGVVERVDDKNIYISDMNYAGYNVVTNRTIPKSQAGRYWFIH
ncbi:hypothetical protein CR969_00805 [Candidatus Saccharibacteria bacterium]|nr:MAG: hypothetical protein CR969_00805 [Candidatus Saccharibacteria bacterium]